MAAARANVAIVDQNAFGAAKILPYLDSAGNFAVGGEKISLVVNGDAMNLTGVWGVYSDERLKRDIQPYHDGLDAVLQLKPVTFHYNGHEGLSGEKVQVGLIAQQVEKVAPYMVSHKQGEDFDDLRVMSTQALPYMLVNAIQELEAKVVDLERRLAAAESQAAAAGTAHP